MDRILWDKINARKNELKKTQTSWWPQLAKEFGYPSGETLRKKFGRFKPVSKENEEPFTPEEEPGVKETYKETDDFIYIVLSSERVFTKAQIVEKFNVDTEKWKVDSFEVKTSEGYRKDRKVKWEVEDSRVKHGLVEDTGKMLVVPLYHTKTKFVKKTSNDFWNEKKNIERLFSEISKPVNPIKLPKYSGKSSGKLLVVPIADFHYGLYANELSTGNEYNIKIAEERYYNVLNSVVEKFIGKIDIDELWFVVGNDFLNSDNLNNTTTRGTQQDSNPEWFSLFRGASQLIIDGIWQLHSLANKIKVMNVQSNHDQHSTFGIVEVARAHYKDSDIEIYNDPKPRQYYSYGKNLIGLTHDIKTQDALKAMTVEAKDLWSSMFTYTYILAHKHKAMQHENVGDVEIYRLPTVSGHSRWSNDNVFISNEIKKTQCFIYDRIYGIEDIVNVHVK